MYSGTPAESLEHLGRLFKDSTQLIDIEAQEMRFISNSSELSGPGIRQNGNLTKIEEIKNSQERGTSQNSDPSEVF